MPLERMPEVFLDDAPVPPQQRAQITELVLRMEDLIYAAGLPRFDRIRLVLAENDLWFIWEDRQLVVAVELDAGPDAVAGAFARATAVAGDPVLN